MTRARKSGADATRRVLLTHPRDTRMTLRLVRKGGRGGDEGGARRERGSKGRGERYLVEQAVELRRVGEAGHDRPADLKVILDMPIPTFVHPLHILSLTTARALAAVSSSTTTGGGGGGGAGTQRRSQELVTADTEGHELRVEDAGRRHVVLVRAVVREDEAQMLHHLASAVAGLRRRHLHVAALGAHKARGWSATRVDCCTTSR